MASSLAEHDAYASSVKLDDASSIKLDDVPVIPMRDRRSIATRIISSNKRENRMGTAVVITTLLAGVGSVIAVIFSRPLMTSKDHDSAVPGASVLVTPGGDVVETGIALTSFSLPSLAESGDFDTYDHLRSFRVLDVKPSDERAEMERHKAARDGTGPSHTPSAPLAMRSVKLTSWAWHSRTHMTLTGADGTVALIHNGRVDALDPPSGVVQWNANDEHFVSGSAKEAIVPKAQEACEAQNCLPLKSCVVQVAGNTGARLHTVQCAGAPVWAWPTGVELDDAAHGRQLRSSCSKGSCLLSGPISSCETEACCSAESDKCWDKCIDLDPDFGDVLKECVGTTEFKRTLFRDETLTCRSALMACMYPNGCCDSIADN